MVVETDWPATGSCPGATLSQGDIPISVSGQTTWVNGIKNVLTGLPSGHGIGVVYWEPGWIGNAGLGSSCTVSDFMCFGNEHGSKSMILRTTCSSMALVYPERVCRCSLARYSAREIVCQCCHIPKFNFDAHKSLRFLHCKMFNHIIQGCTQYTCIVSIYPDDPDDPTQWFADERGSLITIDAILIIQRISQQHQPATTKTLMSGAKINK